MKFIMLFLVSISCTTSATKKEFSWCEEYCEVERACVSNVHGWIICDCPNGDRVRLERQPGASEKVYYDTYRYGPFFLPLLEEE